MLLTEQKQQFSEILNLLSQTLDISETEFNAAVRSYEAVGKWLSKEESLLAPYMPQIRPQGSFMLGTMIRAFNGKDHLDIDLVCQLLGKRPDWSQYDLKQAVGNQLKRNEIYCRMLESPDGRRCWTLMYAEEKYHMDILSSLVAKDYQIILERSLSAKDVSSFENLAMRITDKLETGYKTVTDPLYWLLSNPFGYGIWFFTKASLDSFKQLKLSEAVSPVPKYQKEKLPLQQAVQILKRHRDIMFDGDEDKPISIIITTLAAKAYNKETNVLDALVNIIQRMPLYIEERFDAPNNKKIKWIGNPVNDQENFADKWPIAPQKEKNFYAWVNKLQIDLEDITNQRGLHLIQESMAASFGDKPVAVTFNKYGEQMRLLRENGKQFMAAKTGIIGAIGTVVKNHNFHGKIE